MDKFELITKNLEEVLTKEDLKTLIDNDEPLVHYIGFEISGFVHLGNGLMTGLKIKDLQAAGVKCQIFLADWHAWINEKLNGDLGTIKRVAVGYFKEAMKVSLQTAGANPDAVDFILGTDLYHHQDDYWLTLIEIAKNTTLARTLRSIDILGRQQSESIDFAKLIYPIMQVADIFYLRANLPHAGLDQRKAHVIARDVALQLKFKPLLSRLRLEIGEPKKLKPIALHHHLLLGLQKPPVWPIPEERVRELKVDLKMSKSKPESCVFIHDSAEEIETKLMKAFCPPKEINYNPILDWAVHLLLPLRSELKIKTSSAEKIYTTAQELKLDYQTEKIHPLDLKEAIIRELQTILKPAGDHFAVGPAKELKQELEQVKAKI